MKVESLPDGVAEQDHDGDVDVDYGDVHLAPPHTSLRQTLVSRLEVQTKICKYFTTTTS